MKDPKVSKSKIMGTIIGVVAIAMLIYQFVSSQRILVGPWEHQSIHLLFALVLVFLSTLRKNRRFWPLNAPLLLLAVVSIGYILVYCEDLQMRIGVPIPTDTIIGLILIFVVLEGTRQSFGFTLPLASVVFVLYFSSVNIYLIL